MLLVSVSHKVIVPLRSAVAIVFPSNEKADTEFPNENAVIFAKLSFSVSLNSSSRLSVRHISTSQDRC